MNIKCYVLVNCVYNYAIENIRRYGINMNFITFLPIISSFYEAAVVFFYEYQVLCFGELCI